MSELKTETGLRRGELPPIPDGCGILPVAENRIAFGPHPELLDVPPEGYEPKPGPVNSLEARYQPVQDRLEPMYRRVLARALALAASALLLCSAAAYSLGSKPLLQLGVANLVAAKLVFHGIFLAQLLLMSFFNRYVEKLTILPAAVLLYAYAVFCALEFSVLFTPSILAIGCLCAGLTYAAAAAWGYCRETDLANPLAGILMIVGGGVLLAVINRLLQTSKVCWAASSVAVVTFSLLEMYYAQRVRDFYQDFDDDNAAGWKASVLGALLLVANAINAYLLAATFLSREAEEMEEDG
jgi:FtsH-binding integral membrane protein